MSESRIILEEVQRLIDALESHPDRAVGARLTALLQGIDAVHRTALTHLVSAIQAMAGEAFLNRLAGRSRDSPAPDVVRSHRRGSPPTHGGGPRHGARPPPRPWHRRRARRKSWAVPSTSSFTGSREAVSHSRPSAMICGRGPEGRPGWLPGAGCRRPRDRTARGAACRSAVSDAPSAPSIGGFLDGSTSRATAEGRGCRGAAVLIANVGGDFYAVANRCGDTPLPLHFSTLEGAELRCCWHGCRYDVRTGQRLAGPGAAHRLSRRRRER